MRVPILLICPLFVLSQVHAQSLSDTDREALLENLEKLRSSASSRVNAKYGAALAAYRNAMASDEEAIALYLNCVEKMDFEKQNRKNVDFREWKRKEADRLSNPAFRLALRHQLRWLVLTIRASSEKTDRTKLAPEAQEIVDAIFQDSEKIGSQQAVLNQSVTASLFAQAYDISGMKLDNWPTSPVQLEQIYDQVILPPYRSGSQLPKLRGAWIKRIQQESKKAEFWGEKSEPRNGKDGKDGKGGNDGGNTQSPPPRLEKFLQETAPRLQWNMELDLFKNGDESGAAVRMLAHIEKHLSHPAARGWSDQLLEILKPAAKAGAAEPTATPPSE